MAVTFSRTTGSGGVMAVTIELELYAGALVDGTRWLDGAGGGSGAYPGSLDAFTSTNTDSTNTAGRGLKLLVGTFTLVEDNNVFTIGGDADTVHAIVVGGSGVAGKSLTVDAGIGTSAITMQAEGTLNSQTHFMAIVS